MDYEHQAEIWPIKSYFCKNKISLIIGTCYHKMEEVEGEGPNPCNRPAS